MESVRKKMERLRNEAKVRFESEVKALAESLDVPEHVARMINRTANGITHLSGEAARMMGAVDDADAERIAKEATTNEDGTPKWSASNFSNEGFSQAMLAGVYLSLKRAAENVREGSILMTLSSVVDMSSILLHTIETMADDARSSAASRAAHASHASHRDNKQRARDWYAEHRSMTKDAAAEKMAKDGIVPASFRTIRGYLTGQ